MTANKILPLFTVIIPTKDRADYLHQTLRTCILQDYENLEIIVSDDGSIDHTRQVVEEFASKDSRVRYISPGANVGMWANFEFALRNIKPGFVMALGGDDGILPGGITAMNRILQETGSELLSWSAPSFIYPGVKGASGQLALYANRGRVQTGVKKINSETFLRRQYETLHYLSDQESPMFYVKGVASTRLIDKVKARSADGRFYSCSTPDGYSGIVLAGEVDEYIHSNRPFTIYGVSPSSQGLNYLSDSGKSKVQSKDFFHKVRHMPMHAELASQPYSPLITLMTADYLLTTRDLAGWPGYKGMINFRDLISLSIAELTNGLWANNLVDRELKIIYEISKKYDLDNYFIEKISTAKKDNRQPLQGNAISPKMLFLDGNQFGVRNIFEAALFVESLHKLLPNMSFRYLVEIFKNSINYWLKSKTKKYPISKNSWK